MFSRSFTHFLNQYNLHFERNGDIFVFHPNKLYLKLVPKELSYAPFLPIEVESDYDFLYLYEDRWWYGCEGIKLRVLSRLGRFDSIFARKCDIVSGSDYAEEIGCFLSQNHLLGDAKAKYRYGLTNSGELVGVATFSKPRHIDREDGKKYLSFEWVRYSSCPGVRVVGGMGKLLSSFLGDARKMGNREGLPVEVMSYSDNEWSNGNVYRHLGFREVEGRGAVLHHVHNSTYQRISHRRYLELPQLEKGDYYPLYNLGSKKFLYSDTTWAV